MTRSAEEVRSVLAGRLGERAFAHSVSVAETAVPLAEAYGVDPGEAYLAGILHDWSREERADALIAAAEERGLTVTAVDREVPYLLHARVGALGVREAFPDLPERIVTAVERHTTGAPGMSALDMVVYLADMLEPARDFDGVGALRDAIGRIPLERLYGRAYACSLLHLVTRRKHLHPDTVASWNAIVESGGSR